MPTDRVLNPKSPSWLPPLTCSKCEDDIDLHEWIEFDEDGKTIDCDRHDLFNE